MQLAIFLPNWVGDLVMATPTLRAVRRHLGPTAQIVGIMRPHLAELLSGTDWLDEQWQFDPHAKRSEWRRLALIARMRRERFDAALLLTNSLHTALLAWMGRAMRRIGYARDARAWLLTDKILLPHAARPLLPRPAVESYLTLAETLGCPPESPRLELAVTEAERALGDQIWRNLGLRTDGRVIALNSTGAYGTAKVWPTEHCGALARQIVRQLDHDVLVLCGPKERDMARDIVGYAASPRVFSLSDQVVGLAATKACLERCRLLVSTDSGPRHVGAALGVPVVTLMGSTLPIWIENSTVVGRFVRLDGLDCLGCGKRVCPLHHHRCMRELLPQRVLEEVEGVLDEKAARAA